MFIVITIAFVWWYGMDFHRRTISVSTLRIDKIVQGFTYIFYVLVDNISSSFFFSHISSKFYSASSCVLFFLLFHCCCLCARSHFWLLFWHQTCLDWKWKIASVKSLIFIVRLDLRVCVKSKLCWRQITDTNAWILLSTHFRLNFSDCLVLFFSFVRSHFGFLPRFFLFLLVELDMSSGSFKKLKQMHDTSKHIFHNDCSARSTELCAYHWKLGT